MPQSLESPLRNPGVVISFGVHRRVSADVRAGVTVNALQTLSKSQMTHKWEELEGDHITLMSHAQFVAQARAQDVAQLDESDLDT